MDKSFKIEQLGLNENIPKKYHLMVVLLAYLNPNLLKYPL